MKSVLAELYSSLLRGKGFLCCFLFFFSPFSGGRQVSIISSLSLIKSRRSTLHARDEEQLCCFDSAPCNLFAELLSGERRLMTVTVKRLDQPPQTEITSAIWKPDTNEQIVLPYTCMGAMTFPLYSSTKPLPKVRIPAPLPCDADSSGRGLWTFLWCTAAVYLLGTCDGKKNTPWNTPLAGRCLGESPALPDRLQVCSDWKAGEEGTKQ